MTVKEKVHAILRMFDEGRDADAYRAMEHMIQERPKPWHQDAEVVDAINAWVPAGEKQ